MEKPFNSGVTASEPAEQANWLKQNPDHQRNLDEVKEANRRYFEKLEQEQTESNKK